jgi:hypothetical protein
LNAVSSLEQRRDHCNLRILTILSLQIAPHQQIELLIRSTQFDIGFEGNGVVSHYKRVHHFVQRQWSIRFQSLLEVVALENLSDSHV